MLLVSRRNLSLGALCQYFNVCRYFLHKDAVCPVCPLCVKAREIMGAIGAPFARPASPKAESHNQRSHPTELKQPPSQPPSSAPLQPQSVPVQPVQLAQQIQQPGPVQPPTTAPSAPPVAVAPPSAAPAAPPAPSKPPEAPAGTCKTSRPSRCLSFGEKNRFDSRFLCSFGFRMRPKQIAD